MSTKRGAPAPAVVGSHFVKQYYGEVLSKKPVELHRFYKDESTFCHASGTKEEEPVSGLADIKAKIEHLGLGGATVDLGCGSVDAQPSEGGGVLLMVTGSITIADMDPRQFCQTFFLSRQHQENDRHNYFVRNDIFRFLDVLPEVVEAALRAGKDKEEGSSSPPAPVVVAAAEGGKEVAEEAVAGEGVGVTEEPSPAGGSAATAVPQPTPVAASPVATTVVPESAPSPMAAGAAPPSESQVGSTVAAAAAAAAGSGGGAVATGLDNGSGAKAPPAKAAAPVAAVALPTADALSPESTTPAPPSSPLPAAAPAPPAAPAAPMTYASLAKSWATVAAVGGDAAAPSSASGGGTPAPASAAAVPGVMSGNGVVAAPASNGGWGVPDVAAMSGTGLAVEQPLPQVGSSGGQGSSRPSSAAGKGQKSAAPYIPHHASPAVAASAAAAREAAAAGNGEILPATSLFVRKVDMTIDREAMVAHFSAYGDVTGITMNPTRGYAFIDYRSNDCVQSALSTKEHYVNRRLLVVEERHSPINQRNPRGDHGGRGGRNGGRGRGSGGRDGERGDRRPAGRGGRSSLGRGDRPDGPGSKEGGYKTRGRAEPA